MRFEQLPTADRSKSFCRGRCASVVLAAGLCLATTAAASTANRPTMNAAEILQELRRLQTTGTVLYLAAHPDDENTRLIAYLTLGRGYRTGYLALTRGDGGQNLIGTEIREALGVIRTEELLAARRLDGGEQFFTRAIDFGYSKTSEETLRIWDRDQVLSDIVRVIRNFRPDVIITRFPPDGVRTHGHHTSSAILALEAFKRAADPKAYPEQLDTLQPWQAKRILWNAFRWGAAGATEPEGLRLDVGGYDALLGESFGEIAARSRSMHKSQGFGSVGSRGPAWEEFKLLAGEDAQDDIMDGVDVTWKRIQGAGDVTETIGSIIETFNPLDPSTSVPALLELRKELSALPDSPLLAYKRSQLDGILESALGLYVETTVPQAEVSPDETIELETSAIVRTDFPVTWKEVRVSDGRSQTPEEALTKNIAAIQKITIALPKNTPVSQPYWLRHPGSQGLYRVDDPSLIGRPESPGVLTVEYVFEIGGQMLTLADQPVQVSRDPVKGEVRQPLEVVPVVTLRFGQELTLFAPGKARTVTVEATASRPDVEAVLKLQTPEGWVAEPRQRTIRLATPGERERFSFDLTPPAQPATGIVQALVEVDGRTYGTRRVEIDYDHIPHILLQPPAQLEAVAVNLQIRGHNVGYLPGAGDLVTEALERMGYSVTTLTAADLTHERLADFDSIVLGVRAFNTRDDLVARLPALFSYAKSGGTVVVQYNTTAQLKSDTLAPFPLRLSRDRVTDEAAPIEMLAPDHPALRGPNRITAADFEGWVQERGLYFPSEWDANFTPLLAMNDPGEAPLEGSLLVAKYGQGWFVYTGLSWFRQLPAGVPGAYRIFANLVSLGH